MEIQEGKTLFEGMVSLRALIACRRRKIYTVYYSETRREKYPKEYAYLCHRKEEGLFDLEICPKEEIDLMSNGKTHGGVLALCGDRAYTDICEGDIICNGFFVMTEGVEDPYNFGSALRSLYASGADGVILTSGIRSGADGIVCCSSAGASEQIPVYTGNAEKCAELFKEAGYKIICADLPDSVPVYDADLKRPLLLVIGGEKRGITRSVLQKSDAIVRIEYGREFGQSLTASSAASILAFEVFRQNR